MLTCRAEPGMRGKMIMDLMKIPFSYPGSYMAISYCPENYRGEKNAGGIYLRSLHTTIITPFICRLSFVNGNDQELQYEYEEVEDELVFMIPHGSLRACFADDKTLVFHLEAETDIVLDFLAERSVFNYAFPVEINHDQKAIIIKSFKNGRNYLLYASECTAEIHEDWDGQSSHYCRIRIKRGKGDGNFYIEELDNDWDGTVKAIHYENVRNRVRNRFQLFYDDMPSVPPKYESARKQAAYVNWESYIRPCGYLHRTAMLMSKNWMSKVWSWDHCFNAIALSYGRPQEAWDQFMLMFDYQDSDGRLPDSVGDSVLDWNYCKPPIHGWALSRMMKHMTLIKEQQEEAYDKLSKWTDWWLTFRDQDHNGLCEYTHGNDSGWDNSTAFKELPPVESPDLQAFLVIQMEELSLLAGRLGDTDSQRSWIGKSEKLLDQMLQSGFDADGYPVVRRAYTGEVVQNRSLLPYVSIILGKKLPEKSQRAIVEVLKGQFLTEWGLATEAPDSEDYVADGYWRGPIWAPSTMLILDGLHQCGEDALVKDIAERFAEMFMKSGSAENYDAKTGKGLRDQAYTWTSSAFLVMSHEYLA